MDGKCFSIDDLNVKLLRASVEIIRDFFSVFCSRVAQMLASKLCLFMSIAFVYSEMVFSPYALFDCIRAKVIFGFLAQLSKCSEPSDICDWVMLGIYTCHMQSQLGSARSPQHFTKVFSWFSYVLFFRHVADFQLSIASVIENSSSDCLAQDLHLQAQQLAERVC